MNKKIIAVWFSCGAASAVAAKKTIEVYGKDHEIKIINNPVKEEHHDNTRFLKDVEMWLGQKIEFAINPNFPSCSAFDVWEKRKYMSGISGAPCTFELKKKARQIWEQNNKADFHVLGFTLDEINRHKRFVERERENVLPVLIDQKITKADCFKIIQEEGIKLPEIYSMGYPNANCIGCVKATSASYWSLVRNTILGKENKVETIEDGTSVAAEPKYTIDTTIYSTKKVSKSEYLEHLRSRFNTRFDMLMDQHVKLKKLEAEVKKADDMAMKIMAEIRSISSVEEAHKVVDYAEWRYKEMYRKKAESIPLKKLTKDIMDRV